MLFLIVSISCFPSIISALELNTVQNQINNAHVFYSCKKPSPYLEITTDKETSFDGQTVEYIIITPQQFKSSFQPLINYKSNYLNASIICLEDIIENNTFWVNGTYGDATNISNGNPWIKSDNQVETHYEIFNDTAAKIRNFIRYAHSSMKTKYVLLGGDAEFIPYRSFYGYIPDWSAGKVVKSIEASIVSDLYYCALNGTWNADCDEKFGEEEAFSIEDEADFSAEVIVGRAPINDQHEVNVFVGKVISYETSEKPKNVQLHQSYTNPQHIPDTTKVTDMCQQWIPNNYQIYELYEKDGIITVDQWTNAFSTPEKLLLFHVGNGYNDGLYSWYQLSWNGQKRIKFNVLNAGGLSNSFYPIHISISCLTGDFSENECVAEELLLTRNGGPSACIANSEVGVISRDDAGAYSAEFFEEIFKNIFQGSNQHLGEVMQSAKEKFSSIAPTDRKYRWCFYEINLLGDPETPLFEIREKQSNSAHTVYVDDDFTPDDPGWNENRFNSIQTAIDSLPDYGTIIVNDGIYTEHLTINKSLTIQGIDKTKVFVSNTAYSSQPLVNLHCHSTTISNLTIIWSEDFTFIPNALILLNSECNGNTIKNNYIQGPGEFGILLSNSIRNTISNNSIINCEYGIGLITELEGLFPSKVVITCDNIISHNRIEQQNICGILIQGSIHNYIKKNIFINNGLHQNITSEIFNPQNDHLRLINTKLNVIDNNYWDEPRHEPYKIDSLTGPITIFTLDFSRGLVFKLFKCVLIINLGYPSIEYDYNPAQIPYQP
jgi:parallel beta-helix repeat protein